MENRFFAMISSRKIAELFFCFNTAEVLGNQVGKFLDAFFQISKQAVDDIKVDPFRLIVISSSISASRN
ncbi:MAG: hypothetical protein R2874_04345 [Desulfobacterales bacterium]